MENTKVTRKMDNTCDEEIVRTEHNHSWTPLLRQLLICSGTWLSQFMYGLCVGSPTVLIPQIRREANSTAAISDDMASWLSSAFSFSGFPWVFILALVSKHYGRKIPYVLTMIQTFVAFLVFYCSTSVNIILVSLVMQGLLSASQIVVSIAIETEYISPRYRGAFLCAKTAMFCWGIFSANAIGTFLHWKTIGLLGIVCSSYNILTSYFWPESPYWLATKERYKQCAETHRWLKGRHADSEKELNILIKTQREYVTKTKTVPRVKCSLLERIKYMYSLITMPSFYKPIFLMNVSGMLGVFSGKLVCAVYAIDIIKKITQNESTAYTGMLILDGITILSMYVGCIVARFFKRRTLFLVTAAIGVFFLFSMSLYLYLIKFNVINEISYVSLGLLTLFSVSISAGPMILSNSVIAELMPVRSRTLAIFALAVLAKIMLGFVIKIAPSLFKGFGLHGTFLFFGIVCSVCIFLLHKYLPETKDKTLQEIADSMNGKNSRSNNETLEATVNLVPADNC